MQIQLLLVRRALGHTELDIDRHAMLQCRIGAWRQSLAAMSQRIFG